MSEKGKNPSERSKGSSNKRQREEHLEGDRTLDDESEESQRDERAPRESERKPNRR